DVKELTDRDARAFKQVWKLHNLRGLSAAVYTQTTDVETECNGLMTYDRAIIKVDAEKAAAANRGEVTEPVYTVIAPDAQQDKVVWRYSLERPGADWYKPEFDTSS